MRRKDRAITVREDIEEIIDMAEVFRIALNTEGAPYIVPLNFASEWDDSLKFYFHSAREGRKLDLIEADGQAGFQIDLDHILTTDENPCEWGMKYRSLMGSGEITELLDADEKTRALKLIMKKYGFKGAPVFAPAMVKGVRVFCLEAGEFSAKGQG